MTTLPRPALSLSRPPRSLESHTRVLTVAGEEDGSTERLRLASTLVESALDCIVVMDHEGRIVEFNPAAEETFGYTREEAMRRRVADLMPPETAAAHEERLSRYLETGGSALLNVRREMTMRRADGTLIPIELAVTTVSGRAPPLFVAFMRDLTDCKGHEEDLLDSELRLQLTNERLQDAAAERLRLLRMLVAAHEDERRSIAAAIHDDSIQAVSALAMRVSAMRRKTTDKGLRSSLSEIEDSVSKAVSRLRRLMFDLHPATLDQDGLAASVEAHLAELDADDTELSYSMDNGLTREPSQRVRLALYRVIQEAVVNARKHARARNIVVLLSEGTDGFVARIYDDGVGFSVERIESPAGHLGLSMMRERAEMAGGTLSIQSIGGKGTIVEARIPIGEEEPPE
jgi:PAS domain S-box-containing protein